MKPSAAPVLPPMTKEMAALGRKTKKVIQKVLLQRSRGPIVGGFISDRCHCRCHEARTEES